MNRIPLSEYIVTYRHRYTSSGGVHRTVLKRRKVMARNISAAIHKARKGNTAGGRCFDYVVELAPT